jgi:hypothetical protein
MTDEHIDDLVVRAAVVRDVDLHSPAIHAAVDAALEILVNMTINSASDPSGPASGGAAETYVSERRRRPSRSRRLLTAAAAVLVLGVATVGITSARSDRSTGRAETPTETGPTSTPSTTTPSTMRSPCEPPVDDAFAELCANGSISMPGDPERVPPGEDEAPPADAPLADRVEFAWRVGYLSNVEHTVTTDSRDGSTFDEEWWDDSAGVSRTLNFAQSGTLRGGPSGDNGAAGFDGTTPKGSRTVDYCYSEYTDSTTGPAIIPQTMAQGIRDQFDRGVLVEEGHEVVNGRDTIRLSRTNHPSLPPAFLWLDATTLLPVRTSGVRDVGLVYSTTHEFLPRTDETRELIVPPVPEGFTKVERLRGPEASFVAGCT